MYTPFSRRGRGDAVCDTLLGGPTPSRRADRFVGLLFGVRTRPEQSRQGPVGRAPRPRLAVLGRRRSASSGPTEARVLPACSDGEGRDRPPRARGRATGPLAPPNKSPGPERVARCGVGRRGGATMRGPAVRRSGWLACGHLLGAAPSSSTAGPSASARTRPQSPLPPWSGASFPGRVRRAGRGPKTPKSKEQRRVAR